MMSRCVDLEHASIVNHYSTTLQMLRFYYFNQSFARWRHYWNSHNHVRVPYVKNLPSPGLHLGWRLISFCTGARYVNAVRFSLLSIRRFPVNFDSPFFDKFLVLYIMSRWTVLADFLAVSRFFLKSFIICPSSIYNITRPHRRTQCVRARVGPGNSHFSISPTFYFIFSFFYFFLFSFSYSLHLFSCSIVPRRFQVGWRRRGE